MPHFCILAFAVGLLASVPTRLLATSVIPPDFSELVEKAESIVRSEVTAVRSEWKGSGETRRIVTWVQLRIERTLVGAPIQQLKLEFLGGQVGNDVLRVSGMPSFKVGDRDVLFVEKNGQQMCPLVGFTHGRYLVVPGKAADGSSTIARNNTLPLESVDEIVLPMTTANATPTLAALKQNPLTLQAFENAVTQRARELGRKDVSTTTHQP